MRKTSIRTVVSFLCLAIGVQQTALAQAYKEAVGYNKLLAEVGPGLADGTGVNVSQVEADLDPAVNVNAYYPDTANSQFSGKTFVDQSNLPNRAISSHATAVGQYFFGNTTSMTKGIKNIQVYDAGNFINTQQGLNAGVNPGPTTFRVQNHSYVLPPSADATTQTVASNASARLDYTVDRDNYISVVAANNGNTTNTLPLLYEQAYNSISVGLTNGDHSAGLTNINVAGRIKPDIVAPESFTSYATPIVSSAAALLHQTATDGGMPNAQNSEVMKAIIMAGATKEEFTSWSNTSTQPLDSRYGAGELNVYNSYHILTAGESNGSLVQPLTLSGHQGWDFGTVSGAGNDHYYNFQIASGQTASEASMLLTWNAKYSDINGNFNNVLSLANLDLKLYNSSNSFLGSLVSSSLSTVDNVEHLYLKNLAAGTYTLDVSGNAASDFGLAWNITTVPEPTSMALLSVAALAISFKQMRRHAALAFKSTS